MDMQIKFDGQSSAIDANTLISVLLHYQTVVREANDIYGGGSRGVRLQVNAIEKGSFIIDLEVVQSFMKTLFCKDTAEYVASVAGIATFCYKTYKRMKGKPVKTEEDKRKVEGFVVNGDINVNINVYNERQTREAISKSIQAADEDPSVDGFSVIGKDGEEVSSFDRSEFKKYTYDDFENEDDIPDERIVEDDATLVIVGLNFEKGSKWQFMYNGFKIPIIVKDDALMRKIDEGERFGKGDSIRVKLRIIQKYSKEYKTFENKSYKIVEFYEHIVPPRERNFFK